MAPAPANEALADLRALANQYPEYTGLQRALAAAEAEM
jgi:hypothetical protein